VSSIADLSAEVSQLLPSALFRAHLSRGRIASGPAGRSAAPVVETPQR